MRKIVLLLVVFSLVLMLASVSFAGDAQTVNGWISDSKCGVKGANAGGQKRAPKNALRLAQARSSSPTRTKKFLRSRIPTPSKTIMDTTWPLRGMLMETKFTWKA